MTSYYAFSWSSGSFSTSVPGSTNLPPSIIESSFPSAVCTRITSQLIIRNGNIRMAVKVCFRHILFPEQGYLIILCNDLFSIRIVDSDILTPAIAGVAYCKMRSRLLRDQDRQLVLDADIFFPSHRQSYSCQWQIHPSEVSHDYAVRGLRYISYHPLHYQNYCTRVICDLTIQEMPVSRSRYCNSPRYTCVTCSLPFVPCQHVVK